MERTRLGFQDALWLEMDRPTNLMVADVVVWTATPLDIDRLREAIDERFVQRYPVFASRAVRDDDGAWWWERDPGFDLTRHLSVAVLDDPDSPAALQRLMSAHRIEMLDRDRPLWQVILVARYRSGSAMVFRSHHAVADGMRMVQLAMSLFDATPDGGAILGPAVAQHAAQPAPPGLPLGERVRAAAAGLAGLTGAAPAVLNQAVRLGRSALRNPLGAGNTVAAGLRRAGAGLRSAVPGGGALVDLFSAAPGDIDTVRKLLVGTRNDVTIWTGTATREKGITWSDPLPLAAVKAVAKSNHCTVNDVLTAAVAVALHDYLRSQDAYCSSVTFMVPVNLKALDLSMPATLGNEFALVQLELPTDEPDVRAVLSTVKRRMDRIKKGNEAAIAFRLQEAIAGMSRSLYEASVDLFTNRTLGVLTNVPGPPIPVYLAGALVDTIIGWAPVSGEQPMSFSICSYNGQVTVGIACDTTLVPDYQSIVKGFAAAFERIAEQGAQPRG